MLLKIQIQKSAKSVMSKTPERGYSIFFQRQDPKCRELILPTKPNPHTWKVDSDPVKKNSRTRKADGLRKSKIQRGGNMKSLLPQTQTPNGGKSILCCVGCVWTGLAFARLCLCPFDLTRTRASCHSTRKCPNVVSEIFGRQKFVGWLETPTPTVEKMDKMTHVHSI